MGRITRVGVFFAAALACALIANPASEVPAQNVITIKVADGLPAGPPRVV